MFTRSVAEMAFSLTYILDVAFVALYHIDEIGRRAGDVMSYASLRHLIDPALPNIPQVISSNLNILRFSQRYLEEFPSPPRISYRRCKSLRDILIRAKHRRQTPPPPPPALGAFRCHKNRCKTCPFIAEGTISYTFLYQRTKTHKLR